MAVPASMWAAFELFHPDYLAYSFVKYFDTPIPGFDYSLKSYISQGTTALVNLIGQDSQFQMDTAINSALSKSGTGIRMFAEPYLFITYWFNQGCLVLLDVLLIIPIAYGEIAAAPLGFSAPSSSHGWYSAKRSGSSGAGSKPISTSSFTR